MLAIYEYFDKIKPYLKDMIDDYNSKGEWKIQIVMRIIFVSFIDNNETQCMHTKIMHVNYAIMQTQCMHTSNAYKK